MIFIASHGNSVKYEKYICKTHLQKVACGAASGASQHKHTSEYANGMSPSRTDSGTILQRQLFSGMQKDLLIVDYEVAG
jgi:hypothetical protein